MFFRGVENVKNVVVIVAKDGPENNTTRQTHVRPTHTHGSELISIDDLPPVATFELLTGRGYPNIRRPSVNNIRKMSAIDFVKNKNEIESEKKRKISRADVRVIEMERSRAAACLEEGVLIEGAE